MNRFKLNGENEGPCFCFFLLYCCGQWSRLLLCWSNSLSRQHLVTMPNHIPGISYNAAFTCMHIIMMSVMYGEHAIFFLPCREILLLTLSATWRVHLDSPKPMLLVDSPALHLYQILYLSVSQTKGWNHFI